MPQVMLQSAINTNVKTPAKARHAQNRDKYAWAVEKGRGCEVVSKRCMGATGKKRYLSLSAEILADLKTLRIRAFVLIPGVDSPSFPQKRIKDSGLFEVLALR